MLRPEYITGLDLGQQSDPSALAILERTGPQRIYAVRHLERYALGTPYIGQPLDPGIRERVKGLMTRQPLPGSTLVIDQTGVGRPVVDSFSTISMPVAIVPVTITSGQTARPEGQGWYVPKKDLVGTLQMLLQSGRLLIASSLPLADTLLAELRNFKVKITAAANETFGAWREGEHDDLVLAVALACWVGEQASTDPAAISSEAPEQRSPFADPKRAW